ncbi:unnamed protein product [Phyllotreta striolata]|uniref:Uncharacterized protein n=1 Tax=Phyllotreta striolata TaxID=444603 RepID=A0A9N9XJ31_PHYSR|nr:unnamed protein product [Phyllotreta striolata]
MNTSNIDSLNNRDLVIFLQKIGQHEAAKIIKKHKMNGKALLSFRNKNTVDMEDVEKTHLWRCLTLIQLNPLVGVQLPSKSLDDSILRHMPEKSIAESNKDKKIKSITNKYVEDENGYILMEARSLQEKDKQYFNFTSEHYKSLDTPDSIVQNSEINIISRSSTTSSGYIRPINIQRYEEISVNRAIKCAHQDEMNESECLYDYILQPPSIVVNSGEENCKKRKKSFVLCDLLLNICCLSCTFGCKKR